MTDVVATLALHDRSASERSGGHIDHDGGESEGVLVYFVEVIVWQFLKAQETLPALPKAGRLHH